MAKKDPYTREAANVIKELMERQGVTRSELAKLADVSPSYVTQALDDKYNTSVPPERYESFANALGATFNVSVSITTTPYQGGTGKLTPKKGGKNVQ